MCYFEGKKRKRLRKANHENVWFLILE